LKENDITWISSISSSKINSYSACIETWHLLKGRKILFLEGDSNYKFPDVDIVNFEKILDRNNCNWIKKKRPFKAYRFWFKGYSIYYAVKNKISKYVCWIDADVKALTEVSINLDLKNYPFAAMEFENGKHGGTRGIESGLIVFDTSHPKIDQLIKDYINFWEDETIFDLVRPYDACVLDEIGEKYNFLNLCPVTAKKELMGEDSFKYTDFKNKLYHYIGKSNKKIISE